MKNYVILNFNEITAEILKSASCHNLEGLRFNNDKTKAVISFDLANHVPFLGLNWLSEDSIKIELQGTEWVLPVGFFESVANFFKDI